MPTRTEIAMALEQGMILESDNGDRYVSEENMCGGKYCCWMNNQYGHVPVKLTNSIDEAIEFVS